MILLKAVTVILFSVGIFSLMNCSVGAAEGFISKVPDPSGTSCHMKFPAISEDTLFSDRPVLKSPSEGDIRDFYGPCDYDPLGKEEVLRQQKDKQSQRRRSYGSD